MAHLALHEDFAAHALRFFFYKHTVSMQILVNETQCFISTLYKLCAVFIYLFLLKNYNVLFVFQVSE